MTENHLLNAVDALTLPHTSQVLQTNDAGISCLTKIEHDPRLQHLRTAIVGGIGSHNGGGNEPRLPFDTGALELYTRIEDTISTWYVDLAQKPVYLTPEETLRSWYIAFDNDHRAGKINDDTRHERTKQLLQWATKIDAKFDPPRPLELTVTVREPLMVPVVRYRINEAGYRVPVALTNDDGSPMMKPKLHWRTKQPMTRVVEHRPASCPACGENTAHDPRTGDKILALVVTYRDEGAQTVENATITCRSCEATWEGGSGCRHVAWEIEREEERLNDPVRHVGVQS